MLGEGAGILILEEYEHAKRRGARIYAELSGYGATCDAYHITAPDPSGYGAAMAMKLALEDAELAPAGVDYINAHGTSTELNDKTETAAIKEIFGEAAHAIPVSSTKSMTGHMLGRPAASRPSSASLRSRTGSFRPPSITRSRTPKRSGRRPELRAAGLPVPRDVQFPGIRRPQRIADLQSWENET